MITYDSKTTGSTLLPWVVLIISGLFEAVWAIALAKSEGFSKLVPSIIFFAALTISMCGLAWATRELPAGSSYAIWVAIGAAGAVIYSMATGLEGFSLVKVLLLLTLVGSVVGLKLAS